MRSILKRMLPTVAAFLVSIVSSRSVACAAGPPMDVGRAKQALEARGIRANVKVRQDDEAVHRGTIVSLGEQSFTFQERGIPPSVIAFSDVRSVQGPGISRAAKIELGLCIEAAAVVILLVIAAASTLPMTN